MYHKHPSMIINLDSWFWSIRKRKHGWFDAFCWAPFPHLSADRWTADFCWNNRETAGIWGTASSFYHSTFIYITGLAVKIHTLIRWRARRKAQTDCVQHENAVTDKQLPVNPTDSAQHQRNHQKPNRFYWPQLAGQSGAVWSQWTARCLEKTKQLIPTVRYGGGGIMVGAGFLTRSWSLQTETRVQSP